MIRDVLVIAPLTDEAYAQSEISSLVNTLNAELLLGQDATSRNLLDRLTSRSWKILWFVCHGNQYGLNLADGMLETRILTSFIRGAKPEFVFLNSCSSLPVAMDIYNEVRADFLCTVQDTPDSVSFFTGKQFAVALSTGSSYRDAYLASKPGQNQNFLFLSGNSPMANANNVQEPNRRIETIEDELARINAVLEGSQKWNVIGLLQRTEVISKEMDQLKENLSSMRLILALMFTINIFILLAIIYLVMRMQTTI